MCGRGCRGERGEEYERQREIEKRRNEEIVVENETNMYVFVEIKKFGTLLSLSYFCCPDIYALFLLSLRVLLYTIHSYKFL